MKNYPTKTWSVVGGCTVAVWLSLASLASGAVVTGHGPGNPITPSATLPRGDDPTTFDNPGKWPPDGGIRGHVDIPEIDREPPVDDGGNGGDVTAPVNGGPIVGPGPGPAGLIETVDVDPITEVLEDARSHGLVDQRFINASAGRVNAGSPIATGVAHSSSVPTPGAVGVLMVAGLFGSSRRRRASH